MTFNAGSSVMQQPGLGSKLGEIIRQIEHALLRGQYDWVVVQGATAAAIASFLCRVPVAHVEAGLRTGDPQSLWLEEFNRRVITVATTLHFASPPAPLLTYAGRMYPRPTSEWSATL